MFATLAINNFTSEYSAFNMKLNTTGVKTISIELQFAGGLSNWSDRVGVYTETNLTVKIQAEQGIGCFGIALGVAELAEGSNVIKSCHSNISVAEGKVGVFEGIVETVEYDETTKIYTISFDFTNAVKVTEFGGKSVNELIITTLNFYFTDDTNADYFEGSRTIRFVSISFE